MQELIISRYFSAMMEAIALLTCHYGGQANWLLHVVNKLSIILIVLEISLVVCKYSLSTDIFLGGIQQQRLLYVVNILYY